MESLTPPATELRGWNGHVGLEGMQGLRGVAEGPPASVRHGVPNGGVVLMQPEFAVNQQGMSAYDMLVEQQKLNDRLQQQLASVRQEVRRLRETLREYEQKQTPRAQTRYWTAEEHERFKDAVKIYGAKDVKAVASYVGTRNATQVRTHAQKYFLKMRKEGKSGELQSMQSSRRRCMSEGDLTMVEKRQEMSDQRAETDSVPTASSGSVIQASPLSKHPSGIDLLSVAAEAVKNESESRSSMKE